MNKLFNTEVWYDNESCAAINYLLNRTFRHADLKDRLYRSLESKNSKLYTYILEYCLLNRTVREEKLNYLLYFVKKANITPITMHLYYLYLFALKSKNIFNAHAYFKTFFDRITAEIQYYRQPNKKKKPSYKGYYRGHQLQKVYSDVGGTKDFFDELSRIRNGNPVIHGSCNLINENNTVNDLLESIEGMKNLVWNKIVSLEDELGMD
ncbi:hypothetical protein CJ205_08340 [Dolosicoccus paucivorans]|uniref:HEPN like Abia C-terminal domain-containing protein n=1 Tax=Dolosicoccus paucivorans TaxID=84521 RepID=A0A2N6SKU6_9LACT|nr:Abia family HEPN domain-containing protein [Dolosicoccus paucivorans]PMB83617.1 hypothetical protein CJ206_08185 [Dolosicoccus paucivorans]PMC56705.1 hypothetical protein CJ205_08340 [Dolosicoccus paucivorans]